MPPVYHEKTLLRDLLRIMATTHEPQDCYAPILQIAKSSTGARGGFLFLKAEPHILIIDGMAEDDVPSAGFLAELATTLHQNPLHTVDQWAGCALQPMVIGQEVVGLWGVIFDVPQELSAPAQEALETITHSLIVVTRSVRTDARHIKLGRNQSEFVRIVSHDLRSPLTSVQGFSSMLNMVGELNEKQAHFVDKILSGIAQMTTLVENIQDAGRYDPETGFYEMQRSPCDLAEIVNRIVANHLLPAEKQELTISKMIADDIPIIYADSTMLERAITNLVDNAIKYTPNGERVIVGLALENDHILISVQDSGLGISEEHQKMMFERHIRIPRKEHKRVKGSGLGLFIVRSVARRHGGNAWVKSVEGEGSTFLISIPLAGENLIASR
jgi:signal transduction histidine kinase